MHSFLKLILFFLLVPDNKIGSLLKQFIFWVLRNDIFLSMERFNNFLFGEIGKRKEPRVIFKGLCYPCFYWKIRAFHRPF